MRDFAAKGKAKPVLKIAGPLYLVVCGRSDTLPLMTAYDPKLELDPRKVQAGIVVFALLAIAVAGAIVFDLLS